MAALRCSAAGSSTSSRPRLARGMALFFLGWAASTGALALSTKTPVKKAPRPPGTNVLRRKNPDLFDAASPEASPATALRKPEVMAPAGGWPQLRAAVANGADAVYFGLSTHSARARAVSYTHLTLPTKRIV